MMNVNDSGAVKPKLEAFEKPISRLPKPAEDRIRLSQSSFGGCSSVMSRGRNQISTAINSSRLNADRNQKQLRHPRNCVNAPPMVGPMFGAKPMAMPTMPISRPQRSFG